MSKEINHDRRRFLSTASMTIAAAHLGMMGSANAQSSKTKPADLPTVKPGTNTSFGPLKQIDAGLLNVGYAEAGPTTGPAVILLHGWPYDIHSYVDVAPLLASAGYHVIVPYLRGYGTTRFLSAQTVLSHPLNSRPHARSLRPQLIRPFIEQPIERRARSIVGVGRPPEMSERLKTELDLLIHAEGERDARFMLADRRRPLFQPQPPQHRHNRREERLADDQVRLPAIVENGHLQTLLHEERC